MSRIVQNRTYGAIESLPPTGASEDHRGTGGRAQIAVV